MVLELVVGMEYVPLLVLVCVIMAVGIIVHFVQSVLRICLVRVVWSSVHQSCLILPRMLRVVFRLDVFDLRCGLPD